MQYLLKSKDPMMECPLFLIPLGHLKKSACTIRWHKLYIGIHDRQVHND